MRLARQARGIASLMAGLGMACTVNRPVAVAPEPEAVGTYLQERHPLDLQVTDASGRKTWLHHPELNGDSLVGVLGRVEPRPRRAIFVGDIRGLAQPRFSAGRTAALVGGVVGSVGAAILILATAGSQPAY